MTIIINKIRKFIPPIIFDNLYRLYKMAYQNNKTNSKAFVEQLNLNEISKVLNGLNQDEIYIIGNSPSLKEQDLTKLFGKTLFVCNLFFKHELFEDLKKNCQIVYFVMDPLLIGIDANGNNLTLEFYLDFWKNFLSPNYYSVVHKSVFDYIKNSSLFKDCLISYYDDDSCIGFLENQNTNKAALRLINLPLAVRVRHTPHAMITYGILNRTKNIYLLGLQHNYLVYKINKIREVPHFYNTDNNLFESLKQDNFTDLFLAQHFTFACYRERASLANLLKTSIYDATKDGMLDMFPKSDILER